MVMSLALVGNVLDGFDHDPAVPWRTICKNNIVHTASIDRRVHLLVYVNKRADKQRNKQWSRKNAVFTMETCKNVDKCEVQTEHGSPSVKVRDRRVHTHTRTRAHILTHT